MKKKQLKKFIYSGLGFPIILKNVPIIEVQGELVPNINYNALQKVVLLYLCHKSTPMTGNEIRFIREYFEMTLAEFGIKFGCSHVAVLKWEKFGNHFAKIEPTTDVCVRLFILSQLNCKSVIFKQVYDELDIQKLAKYQKSKTVYDAIAIDIEEEQKIAVNS